MLLCACACVWLQVSSSGFSTFIAKQERCWSWRYHVPDTDDAAEEEQLVDEINLDEGLGEDYNDAEDLTLCGVDDVVSVPSTSAVILSLTTVRCINMCSEQTDDFHAHEVSGSYSHCKT